MTITRSAEPQQIAAHIGAVAVYATAAQLVARWRTTGDRVARTALTLVGSWLAAPLAFLIPPHLESVVVALVIGVYFARRAWVGEWEVVTMRGGCPRCAAPMQLKNGTVLYLPHSLTCAGCRTECWLELGAAPDVAEAVRQDAIARSLERTRAQLDGQPPLTWSPAASDWRDRRRD